MFDAWVGELKAEETAKNLVEMHKKHIQGAQMFQEIAYELAKELKERIIKGTCPVFDETFNDMKTGKLVDLTPKYFRMYSEAATLERIARDLEERMSQPASRVEEAPSSTENLESPKSDAVLLEEKIDEAEEDQHDSPSQGETEERPDSSEKAPPHGELLEEKTDDIEEGQKDSPSQSVVAGAEERPNSSEEIPARPKSMGRRRLDIRLSESRSEHNKPEKVG
jgi:hypothetical protein